MLVTELTGLPQWNPSLLPISVPTLPTIPVQVGGTALVPTPAPSPPPAPVSASFVTVNPESALPNARRLVAGSGIILTDNGPGSSVLVTSAGGVGSAPVFVNITSGPYRVPINASGSGTAYVLYNNQAAVLTVNSNNGTDSFGGNASIQIEGFGSRTIYDYAVGNWAVIGI